MNDIAYALFNRLPPFNIIMIDYFKNIIGLQFDYVQTLKLINKKSLLNYEEFHRRDFLFFSFCLA